MAALARTCLAIVLAAGEGTRMRSATPKVLHPIAGRPMLAHVLAAAATADVTAVAVVIGPDRDDVARLARTTMPDARIFTQVERRGTAHAVLTARAAIAEGYDDILVLYADVPLIEPETLRSMRDAIAGGATVATLGFEADDPSGYGRLIIDRGELVAIREHKDATEAERLLSFCNSGLMAIDGSAALTILEGIDCGNAQGEFYLTDAVEMARRHGGRCVAVPGRAAEVMGVNDRVQLSMVEALWQKRMREAAMRSGVTMLAPETVFLSYDTRLGRDVLIEPHVVFGPGVTVEEGGIVHAFSHLEGARIASGGSVGPYARLRPGADIGAKAKVGNFVEIKNAAVEAGAKISHLSYIGDARVGAGANIGAGTITCNYDGFGKHRTDIGAGAFVGSNSALVAPVSIGDGAFVGSGSVITEDVPADGLALGRARQTNKPDWAARFRSAHKVK